ncbi:unnamed protein product [Strongylus vulgaris]|uniref:Uncharacterized protein n=1 Tax=Strongylus vulgaris TaxID=40348 RepID=A0A3P7J8J2_STRVU|nr:unnamed protein product [Strongylus vulgaris]
MTTNHGQVVSLQRKKMVLFHIGYRWNVIFEGMKKVLPLNSSSSILRAYFRGEDIGSAVRNVTAHLPKVEHTSKKDERQLFERYKVIIREAAVKAEARRHSSCIKTKSSVEPKKPKVHRYSREERRRIREELTGSSL